ncbi:MAG: tetratricopeptide repeat protein [Ignavibacteriales bacterium]|nr:tetratricopeptide repeat protein [Ignavibacteriales bacterium]MCF8316787.1 tetratricopeptide repeat protein [Ignavibacteriales bacterium]MCF8438091.1 tetratricopeptide repeat protein [Ignavibacteriales bacterium]
MKTTKIILTILLLSISVSAQRYVIKQNTLDFTRFPLVDLYFSATNSDGEPAKISENELDKIGLRHNGTTLPPIDIKSVYDLKSKGESELYIAMIFDNSFSMRGRTELLEKAAQKFVDGLNPGDYASIIDFGDDRIKKMIPEYPEKIYAREKIGFSNSKIFLGKAIPNKGLSNKTYMYDALLYGLSVLNQADALGKKVIVFFSDGVNIGSVCDLKTVEYYSNIYDIPIYAIDLNTRENPALRELATASNGEYYLVKKPEDLLPLYESLVKLLKSQYRLTYSSPDEIIDKVSYKIALDIGSPYNHKSLKEFAVNGEKIGFYSLLYNESIGKAGEKNYFDYLSSFPKSKWYSQSELHLADHWFMKGKFEKALGVYDKLLRNPLDPVYNDALLKKAELMRESKNYVAAKKAYEKVLESEQRSGSKPRAMLELAKSYSAEGNYVSALDMYSDLASSYQGTEFASDALLQSATLSLQMGNFDAAKTNFTEIVENYPESKNAAYAKFELANIEENKGNNKDAVSLYEEVLAAGPDPEFAEQTKFQMGGAMMKIPDYPAAIGVFSDLAQNSTSPDIRRGSQESLIKANLQNGDPGAARKAYFSSDPDVRSSLENSTGAFPLANPVSGLNYGQMNTVLIGGNGITDIGSPVSASNNQALREKYPIIGPVWNVTSPQGAGRISIVSIPVSPAWISSGQLDDPEAGLYYFNENKWISVDNKPDPDDLAYEAAYPANGLYAVLTKAPQVFTLYDIYFDLGKSSIRKDAEKNLYEMVDYLKLNPALEIEIAGHCDSTGSDEINFRLSIDRANSIKNFLAFNGINESRLTAIGFGSQYPVAPNTDELNRQKNRRTEFIIKSGSDAKQSENESLREKYGVLIEKLNSSKEAFDRKTFFKARGWDASVLTKPSGGTSEYELILGFFDTREKAESEAQKFNEEFTNITTEVKKY